MKEINFTDIENNLDEVILMKKDVEELNDGQKMSLQEFFSKIRIYSTIFVCNGLIIPFSILSGKESKYFVYCVSTTGGIDFYGEEINKQLANVLNVLKGKLNQINYDLSKLTLKSTTEMAEHGDTLLNSESYFIINNKYYM